MANRFRIVPALALFGALVAAPACATSGYGYYGGPYDHNDRGRYARDVERIAHENGYREGREAGESDSRHGRSFEFDRHSDWRHADEGYRHEYGDKDFYRREFREGFRAGYTDGFNGHRQRIG